MTALEVSFGFAMLCPEVPSSQRPGGPTPTDNGRIAESKTLTHSVHSVHSVHSMFQSRFWVKSWAINVSDEAGKCHWLYGSSLGGHGRGRGLPHPAESGGAAPRPCQRHARHAAGGPGGDAAGDAAGDVPNAPGTSSEGLGDAEPRRPLPVAGTGTTCQKNRKNRKTWSADASHVSNISNKWSRNLPQRLCSSHASQMLCTFCTCFAFVHGQE